jgi:single-strand DNA-binding protein
MKAQGLARIGRDVEVRFTGNGDAVASISLAFEYGKKDANGNRQTQWVEASLWGKRAESLSPYLKKGQQVVAYLDDVCIETYKTKDNKEGYKLAARVSDIELVKGQREAQPAPKKPDPPGFDLDEPF